MPASAPARWIRFAAALLSAAVLLPALHDAAGHRAARTHDAVSIQAASGDPGPALSPESCPICLATRSVQAKALRTQPHASRAKSVSTTPALPQAPRVASRAVPGATSPRAPPSA